VLFLVIYITAPEIDRKFGSYNRDTVYKTPISFAADISPLSSDGEVTKINTNEEKIDTNDRTSLNPLYDKLKVDERLTVTWNNADILIKFKESNLFAGSNYIILEDKKEMLTGIGNAIKQYENEIESVSVRGYTAVANDFDSGSGMDNWFLSSARAAMVCSFFETCEVNKEKLISEGFGSNNPIAPNDTEANMKLNRRVEILIKNN
jgi:flagellar motor protein MotB